MSRQDKGCFETGDNPHFDSKLITLMGFTFADAFHFWHMQTVEFILAPRRLGEQSFRQIELMVQNFR